LFAGRELFSLFFFSFGSGTVGYEFVGTFTPASVMWKSSVVYGLAKFSIFSSDA
jgi:hypothetical protein